MEQALIRIETKLDAKADADRVRDLELRVTQHGRELDQLERTGTANAIEALALAKSNEKRLADLETTNKTEEAVRASNDKRNERMVKIASVVAAIATALNMVVGVWVLLGAH